MTARADRINLAVDKRFAEDSLHEFFIQSWKVTTPGSALCDGWHLEAIAEHLEAVIAGELGDLLILVPPRCGKTLLALNLPPAWAWIRRPTLQFLCASYVQRLSKPTLYGLPPPDAVALVSGPLGQSLEVRRRYEPAIEGDPK